MHATERREPSGKALLVDGHVHGAAARKRVLEDLGLQIDAVATACEAQLALRYTQYDLVIADVPERASEGKALVQTLHAACPHVPLVLISALADAVVTDKLLGDRDVIIQKSAREVLDLMRAVNRLLGRRTPRKPVVSLAGASGFAQRSIR